MSYSPVTVGEDWPLLLTCLQDGGTPLDLSGGSIVLVFAPAVGSPSTNRRFQTTGTVTITDGPNGKATFFPSSADKTNLLVGEWKFQPVVTRASGVRYGQALPLECVDAL